jgi:hypothetical protein
MPELLAALDAFVREHRPAAASWTAVSTMTACG